MKINNLVKDNMLITNKHILQFWWQSLNEVLFAATPLNAYSDLSHLVAIWHVIPKK